MSWEIIAFSVACVGLVFGYGLWRLGRLRRKGKRLRQRRKALQDAGLDMPATLHPVIDPTRCIGSASCTLVCPQGNDVLGLIDHRGALIDPTQCIGHGRCAAECPVGAIRLVFGHAQRGVDLPHLRPTFETNVPGLYITGELGGMGLISNAIRQATEGMNNLKDSLAPRGDLAEDVADVAIIGAGPAGLTSALAAQEHGLRYRFFEREPSLGGAILHYPRRKLVLTDVVTLPLIGKALAKTMIKEELIEFWESVLHNESIHLESGVQVHEIQREAEGVFRITTSKQGRQEFVHARRVMLCVGRRGSPRKLQVPGEECAKVYYLLRDPDLHRGRKVLVVGGGDSALEAAWMLAEETDAHVTLSYRRKAISRAKPENRERLQRAIQSGRIEAFWESTVVEILQDKVRLSTPKGERTLANDDVLILAGGDPPSDFLSRAGVAMDRHFGEETEAYTSFSENEIFKQIQKQSHARGLRGDTASHMDVPMWFRLLLAGLALAVIATLFWIGAPYYLGDEEVRASEALRDLRPAGLWGQTLGVMGLLFMLGNLGYLLRREVRLLHGVGSIRLWLSLHVFTGLMAAGTALLHSAFHMKNIYGTALYLSLGIVVLTGIIGRYLYGFVPRDPRGRPLTHAALQSISTSMEQEFGELFHHLDAAVKVRETLALETKRSLSLPGLLFSLVWTWPLRHMKAILLVYNAGKTLNDPQRHRKFSRYARAMFRLRVQMDYQPVLKRLLGMWRGGHAALALLMIILVLIHVGLEFYVGYRWIF